MNKKRISIMLSGLLMMTMVSCSNKETTSGSSANSDARTVEDSALQGTWAADYSRDEVQSLHEEILERIENACIIYELVQYGTDLSSGQLVLKIGFNLDREAIKEEGKFEFEMTAMSTFSEAFTGNEDRDYSKLNKEIYDIVTNNSGISKVENQLDGLSETITITEDYLIYTLESKEYKFK